MFFTKGKTINTQDLIDQHLNVLEGLQYKSGLFAASDKSVGTGYDKSWLRDNFYECLPFLLLERWDVVEKTANALLRIFEKHEYKLDHAIQKKPDDRQHYIHARVHPETFDEFWEDWGNKQNDAIGALLFLFGSLELHNRKVLRTDKDRELVQKLIWYLNSLEYWQDPDSGMWEENEEVHASSIGACVAGLTLVRTIPGIEVPDNMIHNGENALRNLLPRESPGKFVDLALLSLIWPYEVVNENERDQILKNVEYHLLRRKGVIRYKNDYYYNKNKDGYSEEAEWCFGISWLAIIYEKIGIREKAHKYIEMMIGTLTENGKVPELYFSNADEYNENTPLGWSEAMFVMALHYLGENKIVVEDE